MVERVKAGQRPRDVATSLGLCPKTVRKWVKRAAHGEPGDGWEQDRTSRPLRLYRPTPPERCDQVIALRRRRLSYAQISAVMGLSKPTICRILRRKGLNRLKSLEVPEPVVRYERALPGELLHFDIKKLGRIEAVGHRITGNPQDHVKGAGWEYLHVVIDDHSRIAFAALLPTEGYLSALSFLEASLAFFAKLGARAQRLMTDNGSCYRAKIFKRACLNHGLRHIYTRFYRPKTNGKAERFIQTICKEWAYAQSYAHSDERQAHLLPWLHRYNWHRPHTSLKNKTPISRLPLSGDDLLRLHT